MFRRRLRPLPSPLELAKIYSKPHNHFKYGYGHYLRVEQTITLGQWLVNDYKLKSGADLSCGNGEILKRLPLVYKTFGDFASGYEFEGPIEQTIHHINPVDVFVCSETIEHLDNPDSVLADIRKKSKFLILSTPIGEDDLGNIEHLWGFDKEAVELMVREAGWRNQLVYMELQTPGHGYFYQIHCWS